VLNIEFKSVSRKGIKHKKNEDNAISLNRMNTFNSALFLVCDGVGGYPGGDIASYKVVNKFDERFNSNRVNNQNIRNFIHHTIIDVNQEIKEYALQNPFYPRLASTLVGLIIINDVYHAFSVGDSRVYLRDKIGFRQINEDDSLVWKRYKDGVIKKSEIINQKDKNIITAAIGFDSEISPHHYTDDVTDYFQFLLCSDGLTDFVTEGDIEKILAEDKSVHEKCNDLLDKAIERGSDDDITITLIEGDNNQLSWT